MIVERIDTQSTTDTGGMLAGLIEHLDARSIIFFATAEAPDDEFSEFDYAPSWTNLPGVVVLVVYQPRGELWSYLLFDQFNRLSAQRLPRAMEVRDLTDLAEKSGKALFSPERAPFTAHLAPQDAIVKLLALNTLPLDQGGLKIYREMLSGDQSIWN